MSKNPKFNPATTSKIDGIWKRILGYFSLLITGAGIGWLVGLSVSPVISIVITSIIGSAAAIIAAVSGLDILDKDTDKLRARSLDPVPIAALVVGIVIGSYFGIQARTYDWLEPEIIVEPEPEIDVASEIKRWIDLGMDEKDVVDRMFNREFPDAAGLSVDAVPAPEKSKDGVLFAVGVEECRQLRGFIGEDLKLELKTSSKKSLRELPEIVEDVDVLEKLMEKVLCSDS